MRRSLKISVADVAGRFDALVLRERILVAVGVATVIGMLWLILVHDVLDASISGERRAISNLQNTIQAEAESQRVLTESGAEATNARLAERRRVLEDALQQVGERLDQTVRSFVDPVQMTLLLREVLDEHQGLKLVRVENIPAEPLVGEDDAEPSGLYRHGLRLEFEGGYFEVLDFLAAVEDSRWALRWRFIDYSVATYPSASVLLEVETLSRDEYVVGV